MNTTPENKVKILEYKLAFEQEIQTQKEFEEGSSDLNYRLSFFRRELVEKDSTEKTVKNFDAIFGTKEPELDIDETNQISLHEGERDYFKKKSDQETWMKKAYRQIAKCTHPDMLIGIKSDKIIDKFSRYYIIAQSAYEENRPADIIMVASELDIDISSEIISREIEEPLKIKLTSISEVRQKLGWQWYHVPISSRDTEFKKILRSMGFNFTDEMVKKVIRSRRPSRKVGSRPEKISVKRRKLT